MLGFRMTPRHEGSADADVRALLNTQAAMQSVMQLSFDSLLCSLLHGAIIMFWL